MKKKTKILIYVITFIVVFLISALIRIMLLGSAPERLIKVEWDESVGEIYSNLDYENDNGNQYDLYIPSGLDKLENQYLILFIHGGSFNSGSKEDGESWCKYYATKWYITASVDYTLQNQGKDASIYLMNEEIENAVTAIKQKTEELGYHIAGMAPCGVSAGGTLAMNLAKAIAQDRGSQVVKMAKIFAADLNKKDIAATVAKIAGGTLIIEEAGDLDDETVDQLTTAMEFRTDGLILILEDEQKYVHELLMRRPRFTMKFTAQIYIPDYTVEELEMFGQIYANEQDYMIGDEGWDALYEKISALAAVKANDNEPVTIKDVIDMVAKAINHANGFFRKMKMGQKRYDENDYVILFAKDFGK